MKRALQILPFLKEIVEIVAGIGLLMRESLFNPFTKTDQKWISTKSTLQTLWIFTSDENTTNSKTCLRL